MAAAGRVRAGILAFLLNLHAVCTSEGYRHLENNPPNILFVLADDFGWNDIGYHGSEIRTPNLDKLAEEGVRLENYYVQPVCTPTRSQLLSGRYQIHTGLQHSYIDHAQPNGLPLTMPTIADRLKEQGYATHAVGKWHIGYYKKEYTPLYRGFDSYYGYLGGSEDYFTHSLCIHVKGWKGHHCGVDLWDNLTPVKTENGTYSAHLFTQRAQEIVAKHDPKKPLFLYLPYQSVHGPLQVPPKYLEQYKHIKNVDRRVYAGMVSCMDEGIRNVTESFKQYGLWNNTIMIFSTDNGGQIYRGGNNWPLRGWKGSLFEGGIKGVGFVHSNRIKEKGRSTKELMHVSDWFPTIVRLAGGQPNKTSGLDGYDMWDTISLQTPSPRKELLHNIDPLAGRSGQPIFNGTFDNSVRAAIRVGDWKLITGNPGNGSWIPEPTSESYPTIEREGDYNKHKNIWLFNIREDPTEHRDLSLHYPDIVYSLLDRLKAYNKTAVPVRYPPQDPNCDPDKHGGMFGPWE